MNHHFSAWGDQEERVNRCVPPFIQGFALQLGARRAWGRSGGQEGGKWGEWFGGPPPRAERGAVRYLLLDAIQEQPRHGYEIISVIEERSGGAYRPSPGVVYPTMQMLQELSHTRSVELDGRRVYEITDLGRADLNAHHDEVDEFYARLRDDSWESQLEGFGEVARLMGQLMRTVRRAARRGRLSSRTIAKVREVVIETIQKLEQILTEDS